MPEYITLFQLSHTHTLFAPERNQNPHFKWMLITRISVEIVNNYETFSLIVQFVQCEEKTK